MMAWPLGWKVVALTEAAILIVYSCVIMHEYGHVLTARAFGIQTEDIIMTPLGGIARLRRMAEDPVKEILIAIAGPAVNVVIAAFMFVPVVLLIPHAPLTPPEKGLPHDWIQLVFAIFGGNVIIVLFNMLPAFPSDGGRVFRALLAFFLTRVQATQTAVIVGTFVAAMMAIAGILTGNFQVPFIACLLALFGQMELWSVKYEAAAREGLWVDSRRPAPEQAVLMSPEPGFSGYTMDPRTNMWVEWRSGVPVRLCRVRGW